MTRHRPRQGFTLMHMMVAIPLLATFLYIGSKLFITNNQLLAEAERADNRAIQTDYALGLLRKDVWLSTSMQVDEQRLTINQDDTQVQWVVDEQGSLTRTAGTGQARQTFADVEAARFDVRYSALVVEIGGERYLCQAVKP